jgi:hypothetical protein
MNGLVELCKYFVWQLVAHSGQWLGRHPQNRGFPLYSGYRHPVSWWQSGRDRDVMLRAAARMETSLTTGVGPKAGVVIIGCGGLPLTG